MHVAYFIPLKNFGKRFLIFAGINFDQETQPHGVPMKRIIKNNNKNKFYRKRRAIFRKMKRKKYNMKIPQLRTELKEIYAKEKHEEEQRAVECIKTNPKYFYKFVKSHCARNENVAELKSDTGDMLQTDFEKANCLLKQYSSVFSTPIAEKYIILKNKFTNAVLLDYEFDETDMIVQ